LRAFGFFLFCLDCFFCSLSNQLGLSKGSEPYQKALTPFAESLLNDKSLDLQIMEYLQTQAKTQANRKAGL